MENPSWQRDERVFPGGSDSKEYACNAVHLGSIPASGKSPGEGNGYPLQYFCLENPRDRGTWWVIVQVSQRVGHNWATFTFTSQEMSMHTGEDPEIYQYGLWTRQIKMIAVKGNKDEMPHISDLNCHNNVTHGLSLWVCVCTYPHILFFFLLTNYLLHYFPFLWKIFLQRWKARACITDHWPSG